jgi:serine/threonine-protein kinase
VDSGSLIAGCYRVESKLGRGGMATVYQVLDERTGARLALKRMTLPERPEQLGKLTGLFEREFYELSQLKHPNVIGVLDYGFDGEAPYYTMELLDGRDLNDLAPMPWPRVCEVLRGVCSALAVLHSRRQVHRDISPRNVRCTTSGQPKLIDFGAMATMGQPAPVVGTPSFMAPEVVNGLSLDGRTDLYAVGALAYWLLTGSAAYPARVIGQLRERWRLTPAPIASRCPDAPEALAALVMSLLSLDPIARPVNAAEVMHRLCAIAGLPTEEHVEVAKSYLVTPKLVGRRDTITAFHKRVRRAKDDQGSCVLLEAASGLGRSRVLTSLALDAKMQGALVLQANAARCADRGVSVISALHDELLAAAPDLAAKAPAPAERDERAQEVIVEWLQAIASQQLLVLCVDDVHQADALSLAVLGQLAHLSEGCKLVIATTAQHRAQPRAPRALAHLRERSHREPLKPLSQGDVDELLRSVFGDVPGIHPAGEWTFRLGNGSPRASMELAQHLVDRSIATYGHGVWTLPVALSEQDLPSSLEQALEARITELSPAALEIARVLALTVNEGKLSIASIMALFRERYGADAVYQAIQDLWSTGIAHASDAQLEMPEASSKRAALAGTSRAELVALHQALARMYMQDVTAQRSFAVYHLHAAGALEEAYAKLSSVVDALARSEITSTFWYLHGVELTEWALSYAKARGASGRELHRWRKQLALLAAVVDVRLTRYAEETLNALYWDTGLIHIAELDPSLPPAARLQTCFQRAIAAYDSCPEAERGLHPYQAVGELAMCCLYLSAPFATTWSCSGAMMLERMLEHPRSLSPALSLLYDVVALTADVIVRGNSVYEARQALFEKLQQPVPGLDEPTRLSTRQQHLFHLTLEEILRDAPGVPAHCDELTAQPRFATLGWQARMIHYLLQGEAEQAHACRKQRDMLAARSSEMELHLTLSTLYEINAYNALGDLLGVSRLVPYLDRLGRQYPGWRPWSRYAHALYFWLTGEIEKALPEIEHGLAEAKVGEHHAWQHLVILQMHVLVRAGKAASALALGRAAQVEIAARGLRLIMPVMFELAMASVLAATGAAEDAQRLVEQQLEVLGTGGAHNVLIGQCHEQLASLAAQRRDGSRLQHHIDCVAAMYKPGKHPGLLARYARLVAETTSVSMHSVSENELAECDARTVNASAGSTADGWAAATRIEPQRTHEVLDVLVRATQATGGYLYAIDATHDVVLAAKSTGLSPEPSMESWVEDYVRAALNWSETGDSATATQTGVGDDTGQSEAATVAGGYLQRFGLYDTRSGEPKLAAVAVLCSRDGAALRISSDLLRTAAEALAELSNRTNISSISRDG